MTKNELKSMIKSVISENKKITGYKSTDNSKYKNVVNETDETHSAFVNLSMPYGMAEQLVELLQKGMKIDAPSETPPATQPATQPKQQPK